jgi:hypothetical protein
LYYEVICILDAKGWNMVFPLKKRRGCGPRLIIVLVPYYENDEQLAVTPVSIPNTYLKKEGCRKCCPTRVKL